MKQLQNISNVCLIFQTFASQPLRSSVKIPDEKLILNDELSMDLVRLSMDLVRLNGEAALLDIDTVTRFDAAVFLQGQAVELVWGVFLICLALVSTSYPRKTRTDERTVFISDEWRDQHEFNGIILQMSVKQSQNSIGLGERMNSP
jgi:hypothetical protein